MHITGSLPIHRRALSLLAKNWTLPAALALAALALPARSLAQTPTFNTVVSTYTNTGTLFPEGSTVGDLNGDGKLDVVATDGQGALRVMLGIGNGTFTERDVGLPAVTTANVSNLPASLASFLPRSVGGFGALSAVDVNNDGRLDLACVESVGINFVNYSFIGVLLNTGNDVNGVPQFTATHHWIPFLGVRPITAGDLNGDGALDLIIGTSGGTIMVWLNNGSGAFAPGQVTGLTPGAGGPSVGQGVIADLNGDGQADYVASSNQNGGANIFWGNGNGTLQTPGTYLPNGAVSVAVSDLDADGRPDLLMGNLTGGSEGLYVYRNLGAGSFSAPTLYSISGLGGWYAGGGSVAVADFNGDGKTDAVLSNLGTNTVAVLLGDGSAGFGAPISFAAATSPTQVFAADFNGDAKADVGVMLRSQRHFGVLTNTTPAALPTQTLTILGGSGSAGGIAANVEYYNPATGNWQPAYLTGWHPWGFVSGTDSWINYKTNTASDPGAGPTTNQTLWYLYRVRFTVPADAIEPKMTFSLKADNFAQVAINGVTAGGSTQYLNNAYVNNVVVGQADQVNVDAAFSQSVHPGENTITLNIGDWGGLNGFNFRIDLSMKSSTPLEIVPVETDHTPPVINAPADIVAEATSAAGAAVTFSVSAVDNIDGPVPVVADPASGSVFPLGTTVVDLGTSDTAGNSAFATFNVTVQDTIAPALTVPTDIVAEATGPAGAVVGYPAAIATEAVGVTSLTYSAPSGGTFPLGTTTVNVSAGDAAGHISTGSFHITVQDTTAPAIASLVPSSDTLWSPNHKMVAISLSAAASDLVGVSSLKIVSVTSSEPDNGLGDGDTAGDIEITGNLTLNLRAERSGSGNGRIYTITVEARDAAGNASTRTCTVSVPKSQGKK